ncbi:MAG TPA: pyruvate-binding protein [Verrucomicrobiae bacterium]|nr:pyruvate-binding protein [Verrucomicrobiae bacterium]
MKLLSCTRRLALLGGLGILSGTAFAAPTTYWGAGNAAVANPTTYSFVATGNGSVTAYFAGQTAGYGSVVGMSVNGAAPGTFGLQNHVATYGNSLILGSVLAGDVITFILNVSQDPAGPRPLNYVWSSDPTKNSDAMNHVYSNAYTGDAQIPAGTYVGFEDLPQGGDNLYGQDFDYDDHQFVFTGPFEARATPDGGSTIALLGLTSLGMMAIRSRRK